MRHAFRQLKLCRSQRPECSTVHSAAGHPSSPGAVARLNHCIGDGSEDRAGHAPDRRPAAGDARRDGLSAVGSGCNLIGCLRACGHARSCNQQAQSQRNGAGHGGLEKGRPAVEGGRKRRETKPVGGEWRRAAASPRDTWLNQTLDRRRRSAAGARPMCLLNLPNAVQDLTARAGLNGSRALAVPVRLAHDGCCFGLPNQRTKARYALNESQVPGSPAKRGCTRLFESTEQKAGQMEWCETGWHPFKCRSAAACCASWLTAGRN